MQQTKWLAISKFDEIYLCSDEREACLMAAQMASDDLDSTPEVWQLLSPEIIQVANKDDVIGTASGELRTMLTIGARLYKLF